MLVLTRKVGERIVVSLGGETVTIELLKVGGNRARVGVHAPTSVVVHRNEVWDRMVAAGGCPSACCPLRAHLFIFVEFTPLY